MDINFKAWLLKKFQFQINYQIFEHYKAHQLKPDDPDFVYDKQVVFDPQENCEWDDSIIE